MNEASHPKLFGNKKCPKRLFLRDAILKARNIFKNRLMTCNANNSGPYVRILGTMMALTPCSLQPISSNGKIKYTSFLLDDGTGIIDVIFQLSSSDGNKGEGNGDFNFMEGDMVDCLGIITFEKEDQTNSKSANKAQSPSNQKMDLDRESNLFDRTHIPCLFASSLLKVPDVNMESLRFLEICCSDSTTKKKDRSISSNLFEFNSTIYMSGLNNKSSAKLFDRKYIFHLINCSKADSLSFNDLEILFGCQSMDESQNLRNVLDTMQEDCEIYQTHDGTYLPL
mmetsp:Transcript_6747/g.9725  ORF Transcript_6747/g.9725 Transcript_6747/m.9725 type:complete len:282 (+) Transcript_6747:69-914(+)